MPIKITLRARPIYKYDYDDKGVYCREHTSTGDWVPLEPHCLNCGFPAIEEQDCVCSCDEFKPAMYYHESTKTIRACENRESPTEEAKKFMLSTGAVSISMCYNDYWEFDF